MTGWNILIADDDEELGSMLSEFLAIEGFSVTHVINGEAALAQIDQGSFDLLILDMMMPGMDGLEVLRQLRRERNLPVLVLTARGDDNDRITGLELGADDYLPKPFNARELAARVRAILRRSASSSAAQRPSLIVGPLVIDPASMSATLDGITSRLTTAEFMVLEVLARSAGCIQTRSALSWQALGRPLEPFDRSIDTHVANIRRKLSIRNGQTIDIRSSRGQGYVLTVAQ